MTLRHFSSVILKDVYSLNSLQHSSRHSMQNHSPVKGHDLPKPKSPHIVQISCPHTDLQYSCIVKEYTHSFFYKFNFYIFYTK